MPVVLRVAKGWLWGGDGGDTDGIAGRGVECGTWDVAVSGGRLGGRWIGAGMGGGSFVAEFGVFWHNERYGRLRFWDGVGGEGGRHCLCTVGLLCGWGGVCMWC